MKSHPAAGIGTALVGLYCMSIFSKSKPGSLRKTSKTALPLRSILPPDSSKVGTPEELLWLIS
jgi:hypothetical protein